VFVTALSAIWVHELGLPGREVTHVHTHHGAVTHAVHYDGPPFNVNESWFFVTERIMDGKLKPETELRVQRLKWTRNRLINRSPVGNRNGTQLD
jgi:hypothetical protein